MKSCRFANGFPVSLIWSLRPYFIVNNAYVSRIKSIIYRLLLTRANRHRYLIAGKYFLWNWIIYSSNVLHLFSRTSVWRSLIHSVLECFDSTLWTYAKTNQVGSHILFTFNRWQNCRICPKRTTDRIFRAKRTIHSYACLRTKEQRTV